MHETKYTISFHVYVSTASNQRTGGDGQGTGLAVRHTTIPNVAEAQHHTAKTVLTLKTLTALLRGLTVDCDDFEALTVDFAVIYGRMCSDSTPSRAQSQL